MKKNNLLILILLSLFLMIISLVNFNNAKEFGSFSEEIKGKSNEISELKTSLGNINIKNNVTSKKLWSLNNEILTATEGMLKQYSEFAGGMSKWLKELSYIIAIVSFINIYLIILVYRKYKNVNKNL